MNKTLFAYLTLALLSTLNAQFSTFAQSTAFNYQGRLTDGGSPANGSYDFQFYLRDALTTGNPIGSTNVLALVAVSNGLFSVVLDFGGVPFDGNDRWLGIGVRTNGSAEAYATLTPRQALTPLPYAITAGNVNGLRFQPNNNGAPNLIGGVGLNFVAPGTVGAVIGGGGATNYNGSAYSNSVGGNFGFIGGGYNNSILGGATEATLAGGFANLIQSSGGVIGGGDYNQIGSTAFNATIAGGYNNSIQAPGYYSSIGGGQQNNSSGSYGTVPGGAHNQANGSYSFAAGQNAQALHNGTFVWADDLNSNPFASTASNQFLIRATGGVGIGTTSPGGTLSLFNSSSDSIFTLQDRRTANDFSDFLSKQAFYDYDNNAEAAYIGLRHNLYNGPVQRAVVFGVSDTTGVPPTERMRIAYNGNVGIGTTSPSGGLHIVKDDATQLYIERTGAITGKYRLGVAGANNNFYIQDEIAGGGTPRLVIDGNGNVGIGTAAPLATLDVLGQSIVHSQSGSHGIHLNPSDGNVMQIYSDFINPFATDNGLVLGGSYEHRTNQLFLASSGNVGIGTTSPAERLDVVGAIHASLGFYTSGASIDKGGEIGCYSLTCAGNMTVSGINIGLYVKNDVAARTYYTHSDRNAKEGFNPVDACEVLTKVTAMPISEWSFKTDPQTRHIGPMAQDFYAAFAVGRDDKHIATVDADGVALAAIQGLSQKLNEKDTEIHELKARLERLEQLMNQKNGILK